MLEFEMKTLQRNVTLGQWPEVKKYLKSLAANEAKDGYLQMLRSLGNPPAVNQGREQVHAAGIGTVNEQNVFQFGDLVGLADACPFDVKDDRDREKEVIPLWAGIIRQTIQGGTILAEVVAGLKEQSELPPSEAVFTRRQCALMLIAGGHIGEAPPFLPTLEEAEAEGDPESLNLIAKCLIAQHGKEKEPKLLEQAWKAVQASLALTAPELEDGEDDAADDDAGSNSGKKKATQAKPDANKNSDEAAIETEREPTGSSVCDELEFDLIVVDAADSPEPVAESADAGKADSSTAKVDTNKPDGKKADEKDAKAKAAAKKKAEAKKRVEQFKKHQEESLKMAVGLASKVRQQLGQKWLEESFTSDVPRGMKILAAIGSSASTALQSQPHQPEERLKLLELQKTAVDALLRIAPDRIGQWKETLAVLARLWQREAEFSYAASPVSSYYPRMRRDYYGNFYYMNDDGEMSYSQPRQGNQAMPIGADKILDLAPSKIWLDQVPETSRPKYEALMAQLYLKVGEEDLAFPYIERLATAYPLLARDLVHEFIKLWTQNHDPNAARRYSNPYIFMYGFERKAESIPLTRSKQERNLDELTKLIKRIRALPIKDIDESLFAKAFTNCHSTAEVYEMESIEKVFGSLNSLDSKTLAQLAQQMRQNLAGIWRMPAEQDAKKTRRKQRDIQAEVLRGYQVAVAVVEGAMEKSPDDWQLHLAKACLEHDELSFRQQLSPDSQFSKRRIASMAQFKKAADLYAKAVPTLKEDEQTAQAFEHWFYVSLGATELGQIDHRSTPDEKQPPLIREAILNLPGDAADRHMGFFANNLFTRMSALKPTVKFRYLKSGFEVVGDHKQAREAYKLYDYYKDLVSEIKFVARLDGPADVGSEEPFGVFLELHHTREIERESGGFGRYLQNQNGNMYFSYNYGRPTENYRDKFEEAVRAALEEHFEVKSVTFQVEGVTSRPSREAGWRDTPYAYLLLKARGPQVDKLPSLKIDLDFLDTSGYVVLPVPAPAVPINAAVAKDRPYNNVKITQTLDERQAADGKLVLEVKASAQGLVPPIEKLIDLKFDNFEVKEVENEGVAVSQFDPESSDPAVISERMWVVTLNGRKDLAELPKTFNFPVPKVEDAEAVYHRYVDADLATVGSSISLEQKYGSTHSPWLWVGLGAVPVGLAIAVGCMALLRRPKEEPVKRFNMPEQVTPFSVLALLRNIERNNGLSPEAKADLSASIHKVEQHYFAESNGSPPELRTIAETWLSRTS